jgi:hypothetical protein
MSPYTLRKNSKKILGVCRMPVAMHMITANSIAPNASGMIAKREKESRNVPLEYLPPALR